MSQILLRGNKSIMAGPHAGCIGHHPGTDVTELPRVGLDRRELVVPERGRAHSGEAVPWALQTCDPFRGTATSDICQGSA